MSKHNEIEFANFICKFGEKKILLDLAEEVIFPAFLTRGMYRSYGDTKYFLYQTEIIELQKSPTPFLGIAGRFIKDTTLEREQIFDEDAGLKKDHQAIRSSPSALFVLILNNHKLVYLHETANAPHFTAFRATVEKFIRIKHKEFINKLYGKKRLNVELITKKELYEEFPQPNVELIPLSSDASLKEFIKKYSLLRTVQARLVQPNDEIDNSGFFDKIREKMDDIGSKQTTLTHHNKNGLSNTKAFEQLSPIANQGNAHIRLDGKDIHGDKLTGNNDNFKIRVSVPDLKDDIKSAALQMYGAFCRIIEDQTVRIGHVAVSATEKIKAIQSRLGK
jgi:hypothetical protein